MSVDNLSFKEAISGEMNVYADVYLMAALVAKMARVENDSLIFSLKRLVILFIGRVLW